MSDDVKLTYRRVGELYEAELESPTEPKLTLQGVPFAVMMMNVHRVLFASPEAGLLMTRIDRPGLMPAKLEPLLLAQLRNDPAGYIRANSPPPRVMYSGYSVA